MREELYLGPVPADAECEQLGGNYDRSKALRECRAYIGQLRRMHGVEPDGATLRVKSCPHDFGTYLEVVISFEADDRSACEWAYKVEAGSPAEWDDEARRELGLGGGV